MSIQNRFDKAPAVTAEQIRKKFNITNHTANEFMLNDELESYFLGKTLFCDRERFDRYLNKLIGWRQRSPLRDTLAYSMTVNDVMDYFSVSRDSAEVILSLNCLFAYRPTKRVLVCEKQYFDEFLSQLREAVGSETPTGEAAENLEVLQEYCPSEDYEKIIEAVRSNKPLVLKRETNETNAEDEPLDDLGTEQEAKAMGIQEASQTSAVTARQIREKFNISKNTAIEFMKTQELEPYTLNEKLCCDRIRFDLCIKKLIGNNKRSPLRDTLAPSWTTEDIREYFSVSTKTAAIIMEMRYLFSYCPTKRLRVCEQQYFDELLVLLRYTGGSRSYTFAHAEQFEKMRAADEIKAVLQAACPPEEYEQIIRVAQSCKPAVLHREINEMDAEDEPLDNSESVQETKGTKRFFSARPAIAPAIYVYRLVGVKSHEGYIKIGYTDRDVEMRVKEQIGASHVPYQILYTESAMCEDGSCFLDHDVHAILEQRGFHRLNIPEDNEWYNCTVEDVKSAILQIKLGKNTLGRSQNFQMRPEQYRAVEMTAAYFARAEEEEPDRKPKFLWNAKMRFGKTFASYQLAKKLGYQRVLVLTFKPAVESAWYEDLATHVDFEGWQFVSNKDAQGQKINIDIQYDQTDKKKPIVVFGSFQDLLGTNENGGIKAKNEFIHLETWDLVIFDEYHFGAWRDNAKKLFDDQDDEDLDFDLEKYSKEEAGNAYNETFLGITANHYLFLSGTPFRALNSGEFIEDQIFSWTYTDEQSAKENWKGSGNPYLALPRMVMLTYRIPDEIRQIALQGQFDEFDLNIFFGAKEEQKGHPETAKFTFETEVGKWVQLIRGAYLPSSVDDLKLGRDKRPPMPYSDARLLGVLNHTLWLLPNVASCFAMYNLLQQDHFFRDYEIVVCAGTKAGIGLNALPPVQRAMGDPLKTKTITLSCGKLTTGVTVKPWTGVFMLRNLKSPETYFQTAFRVQSPWVVKDESGKQVIMKQECYVFDFALDRALKQISDYSCHLDSGESNPEKKVAEFINFLPVLAYDGSSMRQISAQDVLDIAMAGTSATLLAKRWESALLVNVENAVLQRLLDNQEALDALMRIEGFRSLNSDITTIINKSEAVKKAKNEAKERDKKEKKEISDEEKEYKSLRKQIQEKLIKFATRVPVFMYLTDYRERSLKDVITQLEPGLFKKVTGLDVKDFETLCSIGLFNASLMNDAIYKFKRYEDSSLSYTGINKHGDDETIGGWDTAIRREEYQQMFYNQQATMQLSEEEAERQRDTVPETEVEPAAAPEPVAPTEPKPAPQPAVPAQTPTEEFVLPEFDVGTRVMHKKFGEGVITTVNKNGTKIAVAFDNGGSKDFVVGGAYCCFRNNHLIVME